MIISAPVQPRPCDNCPSPCLGWGPAQLAFTVLTNCRFMSVATFVPWEGVRQLGGQTLACGVEATAEWRSSLGIGRSQREAEFLGSCPALVT